MVANLLEGIPELEKKRSVRKLLKKHAKSFLFLIIGGFIFGISWGTIMWVYGVVHSFLAWFYPIIQMLVVVAAISLAIGMIKLAVSFTLSIPKAIMGIIRRLFQ